MGLDGAATSGALVVLESTSGRAETPAGDAGAFALGLPADEGERLVLSVGEDEIEHDVPAHGEFPLHVRAVATVDPHEPEFAVVEVAFEPARDDGHVWVANPAHEGAVLVLDRFEGGLLHGGHVAATEGDVLRLHWVPLEGVESQAIEVQVHLPPP